MDSMIRLRENLSTNLDDQPFQSVKLYSVPQEFTHNTNNIEKLNQKNEEYLARIT